jgi:hypothetical protein
MNHPNQGRIEMTNPNITKTEHQKQGEILLAEARAFLALLLITPVSLKEASQMLLKIENWEALK